MAVQAVSINVVGLGRAEENSFFGLYILLNIFTQQ
jgi:hypothetical protein